MASRTNKAELTEHIEKLKETAQKRKRIEEVEEAELEERPIIIKKKEKQKAKAEIAHQWGDEILDQGFTLIPNALLDNYTKLGLSYTHMAVVTAILRYGYRGRRAFPAQQTIAEVTGLSERTVRNVIRDMKTKGYMTVRRRYIQDEEGKIRRTSNLYNQNGLIEKVRDFTKKE